jgi:hypothetical protein
MGFIIIEAQNLEATRKTIASLPRVGEVEAFEGFDKDGLPGGAYQMLRIMGDHKFAEYAIRNQGYATIINVIG